MGGKFHLKLNMGERPIANKYREGKMKRTLKRELKVLEIVKREALEAIREVSLWTYVLFEALLGSASISGAGEGFGSTSCRGLRIERSFGVCVAQAGCNGCRAKLSGCCSWSFVALCLFVCDADDTVFIDPS
jgi:hypothetical protein